MHLLYAYDFHLPLSEKKNICVLHLICTFFSPSDPFQGSPHQDMQTPESHSPASRERSSSLQGMDMASLPPRKRPWHDGPGTPDHREMDAMGGAGDEPVKGTNGIRNLVPKTFLSVV